ncbi:Ribosome quality control complex subunit 1 [Pseudocercospora fuligena]|uniref:Ribosome quality control complex subunit 1 n=1 Tax=Pseudocercospora fuligena TaxID=685502 RepID=A0A8H6VNI8_9PEZI|nr:Ribosome quality control complex subunit 1 [Pseudocercospora fuligena]
MSSRALRKAQREKEEQERLKQLEQEARALEDEEDEEDEPEVIQPKKSAFAMLQDDEDEPEEDEDDHGDGDGASIADEPVAATAPKSSKKKKKKKKKVKGGTDTPGQDTDEVDEIDAALKSLSTNGKAADSGTTAAGVDPAVEEANRLLSIDTNNLHAANEMKRLFGRAALEQDHDDQQVPGGAAGGNRRQQRRVQQVGLAQALRGQRVDGRSGGLAAMALRRNIFIQGKEEWPVATGGGLGMEVEEKRADGTVLYKFVHNTAYQDVQSQFESCVASMDPNRLILLLQHNPYHISTLLQVSEIAKQERDHSTSGDLLERALFSLGRAVHSTFAKNLAEGKARLDFRRAENREFWLASWRYIQNLTMRATWRTVYEWAKMLLSLSPENDPYALWLVLDQYAIRSKQDLDYLNLSRIASLRAAHADMPNVVLSQGLAECQAGNKGKGQQLLFSAIGKYPYIISRLMQELNVDPPPAVWGKEPSSMKEKLYTELYATRAKDLWNTPENTNLLIETASAVPPETAMAATDSSEITQNVARHVILSDTPALIALIPRHFTEQLESASDPLPPDDGFMSYLSRRRGSERPGGDGLMGTARYREETREISTLNRFFSQLFPWYGRAQQANAAAAGEDGAADQQPPASEEEMMRQVREAGISEEDFRARAQRLIELQNDVGGDTSDSDTDIYQRLAVNPRVPGSDRDQRVLQLLQDFEGSLGEDFRTLSQADQAARVEERIAAFMREVQGTGEGNRNARVDDASDDEV